MLSGSSVLLFNLGSITPPPSLHFGPPYRFSLLPSFQPTASKPLHTATFIMDKLPNYCTWNESPAPLTKRERRDGECVTERKRHRDMGGGDSIIFVAIKNPNLLPTVFTWQLLQQIINEERTAPHCISNRTFLFGGVRNPDKILFSIT